MSKNNKKSTNDALISVRFSVFIDSVLVHTIIGNRHYLETFGEKNLKKITSVRKKIVEAVESLNKIGKDIEWVE